MLRLLFQYIPVLKKKNQVLDSIPYLYPADHIGTLGTSYQPNCWIWYMGRFHSYPGYPKKTGWIISWKSENTMDDDWGYPHFSKPSYCFLVIIFSDMVLSAVGVIQMYHCFKPNSPHFSNPLPKPPAASLVSRLAALRRSSKNDQQSAWLRVLSPDCGKYMRKSCLPRIPIRIFEEFQEHLDVDFDKSGCQLWVILSDFPSPSGSSVTSRSEGYSPILLKDHAEIPNDGQLENALIPVVYRLLPWRETYGRSVKIYQVSPQGGAPVC